MPTRRQVERAIELHRNTFERYPTFIGLGVVPVETTEDSYELAVGVYVTNIIPDEELKEEERIPEIVEIPARRGTHKIRTHVIAIGEIELEGE